MCLCVCLYGVSFTPSLCDSLTLSPRYSDIRLLWGRSCVEAIQTAIHRMQSSSLGTMAYLHGTVKCMGKGHADSTEAWAWVVVVVVVVVVAFVTEPREGWPPVAAVGHRRHRHRVSAPGSHIDVPIKIKRRLDATGPARLAGCIVHAHQ